MLQKEVVVHLSDSVKRDVDFNAKSFYKMSYAEVLPTLNSRELANYDSAMVGVKTFGCENDVFFFCYFFTTLQKEVAAKSCDMGSGKKEKKSGAKALKHDVFTKSVGEFIENLLRKEVEVEEEAPGLSTVATTGFDVDDFKLEFGDGEMSNNFVTRG